TLIADYYRSITGEGQHIDVSTMESVLTAGNQGLFPSGSSQAESKRAGNFAFHGEIYAPVIWECKDGYVSFTLSAGFVGARTNQGLTEWMDSEGMAPNFMKEKDWESWDWSNTSQNELDSLIEVISQFFKMHTKEEIEKESSQRSMQIQGICDSSDTVANVQLKSRDYWVKIKHDELDDTITYPGAFAKFSLTPIGDWHRAPLIGEHNGDIYGKELGLSEHQINSLKANGVI
ncbi:CoA transferase, partial [Chloroflexota bacterium]